MPSSALFRDTTGVYWDAPPTTTTELDNPTNTLFSTRAADSLIHTTGYAWFVDFEGMIYPTVDFEDATNGVVTFAYAKFITITSTAYVANSSVATQVDATQSGWVIVNSVSPDGSTVNRSDSVVAVGWLVDCDIDVASGDIELIRCKSESIGIVPVVHQVPQYAPKYTDGSNLQALPTDDDMLSPSSLFYAEVSDDLPLVGLSILAANNRDTDGNTTSVALYNGYPVAHILLHSLQFTAAQPTYYPLQSRGYMDALRINENNWWSYQFSGSRYLYFDFVGNPAYINQKKCGNLSVAGVAGLSSYAQNTYIYWLEYMYTLAETGESFYRTSDHTLFVTSMGSGLATADGVVIDLLPPEDVNEKYFGKLYNLSCAVDTTLYLIQHGVQGLSPTTMETIPANYQFPVLYGFSYNGSDYYWAMCLNRRLSTNDTYWPVIFWISAAQNPSFTITDAWVD